MLEDTTPVQPPNHIAKNYYSAENRAISEVRLDRGLPSVQFADNFEYLHAAFRKALAHPWPASYAETAQRECDLVCFVQRTASHIGQSFRDKMIHQTAELMLRHKRLYPEVHPMTRGDFDAYFANAWIKTLHTLTSTGSAKMASHQEFLLNLRMFAYHDRHGPYVRYLDYLDTLYSGKLSL